MPQVEIVFFQEDDLSEPPLLSWFSKIGEKGSQKCWARIQVLSEQGYEAKRPLVDYLRDGIYELRMRFQNKQQRILYFFFEDVIVLTHGFSKKERVPDREIKRAVRYRTMYKENPESHTFKLEMKGR